MPLLPKLLLPAARPLLLLLARAAPLPVLLWPAHILERDAQLRCLTAALCLAPCCCCCCCILAERGSYCHAGSHRGADAAAPRVPQMHYAAIKAGLPAGLCVTTSQEAACGRQAAAAQQRRKAEDGRAVAV